MKLTTLIFLICNSVFCQVGQVNGHINLTDSALDYKYIIVYIMQNDSAVSASMLTEDGDFKINNLKYGNYNFKITQLGLRDNFKEFSLREDSITINIDYPICPFVKKGKKPKCPFGHSDNIIPTMYGLPSQKIIKKAKKGLIHLGGCEMYDDCNSFYFCKTHDKEI